MKWQETTGNGKFHDYYTRSRHGIRKSSATRRRGHWSSVNFSSGKQRHCLHLNVACLKQFCDIYMYIYIVLNQIYLYVYIFKLF